MADKIISVNDIKIAYEKKVQIKTKKKVSDIARDFGVTRSTVLYSTNFFESLYGLNTHLRHQMILGSILGDCYIQNKDGKFVYRECHSLAEEEYLKWKFLMMGEFTYGNIIYDKNIEEGIPTAKEFCTKVAFSDVFEYYYNLSVEEVIKELDIYGLIIFLLDDGWYNNHSKNGNLLISGGVLSEKSLNLICNKFKQYNIEANIIGLKRKDISIESKYNFVILSYAQIIFPSLDLDVIKKKLNKIANNYTKLLS